MSAGSVDDASDACTTFLIAAPQANAHLLIIPLELGKTIELSTTHLEQQLKLVR